MAPHNFDDIAAIERHCSGLAAVAAGNFELRVEHCPDWSVADLLWHVSDVHWFWATIAEGRLDAPPEESRRPARPVDSALIDHFRAGAARLADVLRRTPYTDPAWTWAPAQQDVGFIARHQVQEAAVHHWDAANAAGAPVNIDPIEAADAVEEFLTFSVSSAADPAEPLRPSLDGRFALRCTDIDAGWTISDDAGPGTVRFAADDVDTGPAIAATASDLLLWLYRRVDIDTGAVDSDLLRRFRALTFTD